MLDCLVQKAVRGIPLAGRPVERGHAFRVSLIQPGLQEITKEMVVPIPLLFIIQRNHKQIRLLEVIKNRG